MCIQTTWGMCGEHIPISRAVPSASSTGRTSQNINSCLRMRDYRRVARRSWELKDVESERSPRVRLLGAPGCRTETSRVLEQCSPGGVRYPPSCNFSRLPSFPPLRFFCSLSVPLREYIFNFFSFSLFSSFILLLRATLAPASKHRTNTETHLTEPGFAFFFR